MNKTDRLEFFCKIAHVLVYPNIHSNLCIIILLESCVNFLLCYQYHLQLG
jgi:hypothetical protein